MFYITDKCRDVVVYALRDWIRKEKSTRSPRGHLIRQAEEVLQKLSEILPGYTSENRATASDKSYKVKRFRRGGRW